MRPAWLRRGDVVIIGTILAIVLFSGIIIWFNRAPATRVSIQYPDGSTALFSIDENRTVAIEGDQGIHLVVEIADRRVRVKHSECPDQVCVHSGWLSESGQAAACVPAGVCVQVVGGESQIDGVTA